MYHFTIETRFEVDSLLWLAARYTSAEMLLDCFYDTGEVWFPVKVEVPEHVAWQILDATEEDGANRGTVPCLGGRLGDEIHKMLESVI